jgi:hypothetical protein
MCFDCRMSMAKYFVRVRRFLVIVHFKRTRLFKINLFRNNNSWSFHTSRKDRLSLIQHIFLP